MWVAGALRGVSGARTRPRCLNSGFRPRPPTRGQHEAFGETVRAWTPRRDLDHRHTRVRHDRVERRGELSGAIADEEPKPGGMAAEVYDEVAGLLGRRGRRPSSWGQSS